MNGDLATILGDVGGALAFGISAFVLLRNVLKESADERGRWLQYLSDNSDRNLRAIYGLEKALTELTNYLKEQERNRERS